MKNCFRIFQIIASTDSTKMETHSVNKEEFKYHEDKGDFKNYSDANIWLQGLSKLKGQFVIMEVYTKITTN
jgi:hypothetical protein